MWSVEPKDPQGENYLHDNTKVLFAIFTIVMYPDGAKSNTG